MTNQDAGRILNALAVSAPEYEALSAEYQAALSGGAESVELPPDFAPRTLELFRTNPDTAAKIDRYAENLSRMQSYGLAEVQTTLLLIAALVLLMRPHVDFRTEWDLKFFRGALRFDTADVDEKALKPVLAALSAAAKKASEGLDSVAKALDGQEDDETA
ncbi:MAG: hypothetical protein IJQ81_09000 [Oscillibacter sp.]|nr:hypothetical protein [Oscillibacter sp.]